MRDERVVLDHVLIVASLHHLGTRATRAEVFGRVDVSPKAQRGRRYYAGPYGSLHVRTFVISQFYNISGHGSQNYRQTGEKLPREKTNI